jgi:hypothetical protein
MTIADEVRGNLPAAMRDGQMTNILVEAMVRPMERRIRLLYLGLLVTLGANALTMLMVLR